MTLTTVCPPRVAATPAARMADAARRVIDQAPPEDLHGETLEALEQLGESIDAALRDASRRRAALLELAEVLVRVMLDAASGRPEGA